MDTRGPEADVLEVGLRARALTDFFAELSPRTFADLVDAGLLDGAELGRARAEWDAAMLHACVRGVVSLRLDATLIADVVDGLHDRVFAQALLGPAYEASAQRAHLATRYGEYDGLARQHGQVGGDEVPGAIAAACAAHIAPRDAVALREALGPILEALATGAARVAAELDELTAVLPPREGLLGITARLDAEGIVWAVGGSALLAALGLVERVNDWDVQVAHDPEPLRFLFASVPHTYFEHGGCHADWKLTFEAERTELIPHFAFFAPYGVVRIPLHRTRVWNGLPIASPEGWACAYWLMGRYDEHELRARRATRAELLFDWLTEHGADEGRVRELLAEPLPPELAVRLRGLLAA